MRLTWNSFGAVFRLLALSVVLTLASATFATAGSDDASSPTISSDKADYAPGETVTLTGTNWQPGESVHLSVTSEGGDQTWSRDVDVIADENGEITDQFRLPDYVIPKYNVSATGATSGTATTSFTDGNVRASADLPGSDSWTLTKTFYSSSTSCATTPSSTQVMLSGTNTDTTAATSTQSVKLEASSASSGGQRFFSQWTGPSGFTSTSGTICVEGFGGSSTRDYVANYVPALSINDVTVTEGNAGTTNATFTVSLSASSSQQVTVNFATANDTAIQPGDYTSNSGTLTFASGETTKSVTVTVNGDTLEEADETFFVNLSGATNATISDNQGVGTITNDDVVNDAPVNSVPGPQTTDEDTALVFSGASKISISDPDAGSDPVEVELEVDEGTLTLSGTTGLSFTVGGNGMAKMTFTGTINDINAALDGMRYDPAANYEGAAQLSIVTNDQGHNGSGGARSDTDSVGITVSAVNDAPTADTQSVTTDEDTAKTITLVGRDSEGDELTFEIASDPAHGTLGAIGAPTCTGTTPKTCQADVTYTPAANYNGPDSFEFRVNDGTVNSADATVSVTVIPVNDKPNFIKGEDPSVIEDSGDQEFPGWATGISAGPANESDQTVWFEVSNVNAASGDAMFTEWPELSPGGTLTFTPAENASGEATFDMRLMDDGGRAGGGEDASDEQRFKITIGPIDDHPTKIEFVRGPDRVREGKTKNYRYEVEDIDDPSPIVESCGARAEKIDTPAESSFKCFFPDGPGASNVSARAGPDAPLARDKIKVGIVNVAPEVTLNGPSEAEEGQRETYEFTIDDPGDDAFGFAAGYPKCGVSSRLAGNPSIDGGRFRCEFHSGLVEQIVALKVTDSDGAFSNEAIKEVTVKSKDRLRTGELKGARAENGLRDEADSDVPDDSPNSGSDTDACGADPGDRTVSCP